MLKKQIHKIKIYKKYKRKCYKIINKQKRKQRQRRLYFSIIKDKKKSKKT